MHNSRFYTDQNGRIWFNDGKLHCLRLWWKIANGWRRPDGLQPNLCNVQRKWHGMVA